MTYGDIVDTIQAEMERRNDEHENQARLDYRLAALLRVAIHAPREFPETFTDAYPEMTKEQKAERAPEDWRLVKADMAVFAKHHNEAMKKQKGGGSPD